MKTLRRATGVALATAAITLATAGAVSAETPIWALPGVDLGPVLAPTTAVPGALSPAFDLLRLIGA